MGYLFKILKTSIFERNISAKDKVFSLPKNRDSKLKNNVNRKIKISIFVSLNLIITN